MTLIHDSKAVEIIRTLGIDTKPYDKLLSHEGVIARTLMLDRQLREIIKQNPSTVIVNIGAGFDNRFERVDNGHIQWFDLDLPDTIELRKKIFEEKERVRMISGDVLSDKWCEKVREAVLKSACRPVFIAEGLFMYLTLEEITKLFKVLIANFSNGLMIAEQNNKLMVKNSKHHDTVKNTNAVFKSGTDSAQEIVNLIDGIRLISEHSFNEEMKKYTLCGKAFALLFPKMNDRWATFAWGE